MKTLSENKLRQPIVTSVVFVLVLCFFLQSCSMGEGFSVSGEPVMADIANETTAESTARDFGAASGQPVKAVQAVSSVRLISCGDAMCEQPIQSACYNYEGNYFNFFPCFEYVDELLQSADIAAANLEGVCAGITKPVYLENQYHYSRILIPDSFVNSLALAGFNLLTTANNHSNDAGTSGMLRTLETLDRFGIKHTGTRSSVKEKPYVLMSAGGINFAFFAGTYEAYVGVGKNLNGNIIEKGDEELFGSFFDRASCDEFFEILAADIESARKDGADVVVYYPHWGTEFSNENNSRQLMMAQGMCAAGVDLIVGAHPHAVQNIEVITDEESGRSIPCAYSLGSILTHMGRNGYFSYCEDGVVLVTEFTLYSDGSVALTDLQVQPIWVNRYTKDGARYYQPIPLSESMCDGDFGLENISMAQASYERTMRVLGDGLEDCIALCAE